MRQRWQTSLVLIALIASQNLCSFARQIPPQKHFRSISRQQHEEDQPVATQKVRQHNGDGHLMNTVYLMISFTFNSWFVAFCILLFIIYIYILRWNISTNILNNQSKLYSLFWAFYDPVVIYYELTFTTLMRHFESLRKMDIWKLRRCSFSFLLPLLIILVLQIALQQYRKLQQNRYPTFAFFLFLFFLLLIYNDLNYNPVFYTHWQRMVFFYNTLTRVLASLIKC